MASYKKKLNNLQLLIQSEHDKVEDLRTQLTNDVSNLYNLISDPEKANRNVPIWLCSDNQTGLKILTHVTTDLPNMAKVVITEKGLNLKILEIYYKHEVLKTLDLLSNSFIDNRFENK